MTVTVLSPTAVQKFFDNNGAPLAYGKLYTYAAGTATPIATYTDSTGTTQNTNPIILNARGECNLWLMPNTGYKYVLQDSLGNTIYTTDQIFNNQLLTLYGGVDTGTANNYVLTFAANFQSYADGIVIYWIPANTNTSNSTINVNGLGVVNLVNSNGASLTSGQVVANTPSIILYKGGQFLLIQSGTQAFTTSGSFTGTFTGFTVAQTGTVYYTKTGNLVSLSLPQGVSGVSNSTSLLMSGIPSILSPVRGYTQYATVQDNGGSAALGLVSIAASGTSLSFTKDIAGDTFTASGNKTLVYFYMNYQTT